MVAKLLAERRLEVVLTSGPEEDDGIFAVYPSARHLAPKVRAFIDMLTTGIPGKSAQPMKIRSVTR